MTDFDRKGWYSKYTCLIIFTLSYLKSMLLVGKDHDNTCVGDFSFIANVKSYHTKHMFTVLNK